MIHEKRLAILDTLMTVAWADGTYEERERAIMVGIMEAMQIASPPGGLPAPVSDQRHERRPLAEVLDPEEREYLYQQACRLSLADRKLGGREVQILVALREALELSAERAEALESAAWELSV